MRQRITFFHRPESSVDPALLRLTDTKLTGPTIDAQREDRITLGLDEVPAALAHLLSEDVLELHVHWVAPTAASELVSPLLSRLSPGLHVFYTPQAGGSDSKLNTVCSLLRNLFGQRIDCQSTASSANYLGNDRPPTSTAYQFYSPVDDLSGFAEYVNTEKCLPTVDSGLCVLRASPLGSASSLDLTYDALSRTLKVTTQWPFSQQLVSVTGIQDVRTEVGVMAADSPRTLGPYEIGMSGHLAVLGEDNQAKAVMFAFPSRHHDASESASFAATFAEPTGLHPVLQLRITSDSPPRNDGSCRLYTYMSLPRYIFADRYQLSDELFLASKNLAALRHMTLPVDLEAPDYAVSVWGSAVLVELAPPATSTPRSEWTAEVPLHLRYLLPADGGYQSVDVPYPVVFWACKADYGTNFANNPFDRAHVGYDSLFDTATEFWHLKPDLQSANTDAPNRRLMIPVRVPVLDSSRSQWVNVGTTTVILLGFIWVLWKLASIYMRTDYGRSASKEAAKPLKKTQ